MEIYELINKWRVKNGFFFIQLLLFFHNGNMLVIIEHNLSEEISVTVEINGSVSQFNGLVHLVRFGFRSASSHVSSPKGWVCNGVGLQWRTPATI